MRDPECYEVYAIRYGTRENRQRHENFIVADPHEGQMPIDYYVWAIINNNRTIVVDTGFDHEEGKARQREILRLPSEGLAMLDVDAAKVKDVIITHLHYDHAGTLDHFPEARFHLQELELNYTTGRNMCVEPLKHAYTAEHICSMVRRLFEGRVVFHDKTSEVAPGVSVHHVGGHTMGLQFVRVFTRRGWLVLASDASHFYENMERTSPFPIVYNVGDMVRGFETMQAMADSPQHIIPGHDPLVMARYPAPEKALEGVVARLDMDPRL